MRGRAGAKNTGDGGARYGHGVCVNNPPPGVLVALPGRRRERVLRLARRPAMGSWRLLLLLAATSAATPALVLLLLGGGGGTCGGAG